MERLLYLGIGGTRHDAGAEEEAQHTEIAAAPLLHLHLQLARRPLPLLLVASKSPDPTACGCARAMALRAFFNSCSPLGTTMAAAAAAAQ